MGVLGARTLTRLRERVQLNERTIDASAVRLAPSEFLQARALPILLARLLEDLLNALEHPDCGRLPGRLSAPALIRHFVESPRAAF